VQRFQLTTSGKRRAREKNGMDDGGGKTLKKAKVDGDADDDFVDFDDDDVVAAASQGPKKRKTLKSMTADERRLHGVNVEKRHEERSRRRRRDKARKEFIKQQAKAAKARKASSVGVVDDDDDDDDDGNVLNSDDEALLDDDSDGIDFGAAFGVTDEQLATERRLDLLLTYNAVEYLNSDAAFRNFQRLRLGKSLIHGWGLFALRPIAKDEVIIQYCGELIRHSLADKREEAYRRRGWGANYMFRLDARTVVDATCTGGSARFINHSCSPNCVTHCVVINGRRHIFLFAKRDIMPGEELAYDYMYEREGDDMKIDCYCGSARCAGTMN
jgi:hypothetical protein